MFDHISKPALYALEKSKLGLIIFSQVSLAVCFRMPWVFELMSLRELMKICNISKKTGSCSNNRNHVSQEVRR